MHSMREECRKKNSKRAGVAFVCAANLWLKTAGGLLKDGTNAWKHFSERLSSQEIRDDHILNLTKLFETKCGLPK
jgi:hypothetical protein